MIRCQMQCCSSSCYCSSNVNSTSAPSVDRCSRFIEVALVVRVFLDNNSYNRPSCLFFLLIF
jgi:hypothetical protein